MKLAYSANAYMKHTVLDATARIARGSAAWLAGGR